MLSIIHYYCIGNQNHTDIALHTKMAKIKKTIVSVGKIVEKFIALVGVPNDTATLVDIPIVPPNPAILLFFFFFFFLEGMGTGRERERDLKQAPHPVQSPTRGSVSQP